jgi:hypothetical protein
MKKEDYPSLFRASDKVSIDSQKNYIVLFLAEISLVLLGAGISIYNFSVEDSKLIVYVISGVLFLFGIIISIIQKVMRYDNLWYQGRALAESCKTITWRYISCSEEFNINIDDNSSRRIFLNKIDKLSKEFEFLNKHLDKKMLVEPNITDKMSNIRSKNLYERKEYYLKERIEDQKKWYSKKAKKNKDISTFCFILNIISHIVTIICIGYLIFHPKSNWNFVGLFTTISTSIIAWVQLKQYQNLNQSYSTASIELNLISDLGESIQLEEEFSQYVLDSENAISREHTTWLAQTRKIN